MTKKAIIYLHGFNSASLDMQGHLLTGKEKLRVLQAFCSERDIVFFSPNVDYRDFANIVEDMLYEWNQFLDRGYQVIFMGSSMGGFASEYLAMKTAGKAVMINPAIDPSALLPQFVGVDANYETGQPYRWELADCRQYRQYQQELAEYGRPLDRIILLDMADELLDAEHTRQCYQDKAQVICFDGGSHGFEHMQQALPLIEAGLFPEATPE